MVKFSPLSELDSNKRVDVGNAIVLYCEVSHAFAKVMWFKGGEELQVTDGLNIQSDGNMRRIVIHSAEAAHSGVYTCETSGDVIRFNVDVAGKKMFMPLNFLLSRLVFQLFTSFPPLTCSLRSPCGVLSCPRGGAP